MRLISALVAALFCSQVFAGEAIFTLVGVGISNDSKTIYIQTLESQSTSVCSIPNTFRLSTTAADSIHKEIYATALLAMASGRQLKIGYSDSQCLNNGPQIRTVLFIP
jgi:hypothetical protein